MNVFRIGFVSLLGFAALGSGDLSGERISLGLRDVLEMAERANFEVLIAEESREAARQGVARSRSSLLPHVSVEVDQSRSRNPLSGFGQGGEPGQELNRTFVNRFDALIRARMSLLNLDDRAQLEVSRFNLRIVETEIERVVQQMLNRIADAYFTHHRNIQRLQVIDANLERDEVLLRIARNQLEGGVATPLDVTRAEVSLATNELARLAQETEVMESGLRLKRILNLPLYAELDLEAVEIPQRAPASPDVLVELPRVLDRRPEYRLERERLERNRYSRRAADWQRLPSVDLSGSWGYAAETISDDMREQWRVGVGVSVPIFEGGRIRANQLEADSAIRGQTYVLQDLEKEIEAELRLAVQDLRSRYNQVEVATKTVELNRREFDLARNRFEEGVADNADVVTAMARLAEAEGVLVDAKYAYHLSWVRMARVRGDVRDIIQSVE